MGPSPEAKGEVLGMRYRETEIFHLTSQKLQHSKKDRFLILMSHFGSNVLFKIYKACSNNLTIYYSPSGDEKWLIFN